MNVARCIAQISSALLVLWPAHARAELPPPAQVVLALPRCRPEPYPRREILDVLRIELAQEGVGRVLEGTGAPGAVRLEIVPERCELPIERITLRLVDPRTSPAERAMDVSDLAPRALPRAIALAAAELARSLWTRPETARPDAPLAADPTAGAASARLPDAEPPPAAAREAAESTPPAVPPAANATAHPRRLSLERSPARRATPQPPEPLADAAPRREASKIHLFAAGSARVYVMRPSTLLGGALSIALGRARLGGEAVAGSAPDRNGHVVSSAAWFTSSLELLRWGDSERSLALAPSLGLGAVWVRGVPFEGVTGAKLRAPYVEGALEGRARLHLSPRLDLEATVPVGWAYGVVAISGEHRAATISGPVTGARVGLVFWPSRSARHGGATPPQQVTE